jgi:uncharacterized protein (TIRG00374 family)
MRRGQRAGRNRLRNALRLIVGITVSLVCLYFATKGTDWEQVGAVLAAARPGWIAALIVASLATVYIRAQRWRVLLRPLGDVPLYPALSATAIGFGANSVLPFRMGEILRPALLGRRVGVGISAALSSIVLERLFDMLLVISCFVGVSLIYPEVPPKMRQGAFGLAGLATLGFLVLVVMQRHHEKAEALMSWVFARLPAGGRLHALSRSFMDGLSGLRDLRTVLVVLGYSVYLWGVITLTFMFSFLALDIEVPLLAASLTTVVVVAAAVFLPQAPGFVGTWQFGCVQALKLFGVSQEVAVGYSLLTWVLQMAINISTAGLFLVREDLSLGQLVRLAPRETPAAGAEG